MSDWIDIAAYEFEKSFGDASLREWAIRREAFIGGVEAARKKYSVALNLIIAQAGSPDAAEGCRLIISTALAALGDTGK